LNVPNNYLLEELYCYNNKLTSLEVSGSPLLRLLECGKNQLTSLDVSNNPQIEEIFVYGNPFIWDQPAVMDFAQSLPNRTGVSQGYTVGLSSVTSWISTICTAKNWLIW